MYSFTKWALESLGRYDERALNRSIIMSYLAVFDSGVEFGTVYKSQQNFDIPLSATSGGFQRAYEQNS
jgi:hypothetical protein